ncbi:MAG: O-antigen ligase family protein, partial [Planctomycetota bacterium]
MNVSGDDRLPRLLEGFSFFLLLLHLVLRFSVSTDLDAAAMDLFIHGLVWIGACVWLLARLLRRSLTFRLSGLEIPLLLWAIVCVLSVQQASYKLPAIKHAFVFVSYGVLFLWIVSAWGPERRHLLAQFLSAAAFAIGVYAILQIVWVLPHIRETYQPDPSLSFFERHRLEIRLAGNEAFGTFFYPNTLAGFLILAIPFLFGSLLDALRVDRRLALFKGAALLVCLVALLLTGSTGGWMAFGAAAIAFAGLHLARRSEGLRRAVTTALVAAVLLGAVLVSVGPLRPSNLGSRERNRSMWMRSIYWNAGAGMAKEHPVLGVGLHNYVEHYGEHKPDTQKWSAKAHNDYLQILAETGVPGLLLLLLILFLIARTGLRPASGDLPPPDEPEKHRIAAPAAAVVAIVLAFAMVGAFNDINNTPVLAVVVAALWLAYLVPTHRAEAKLAAGPMEFLRIGTTAGFLGLCAHMVVDFDFYDFGTGTALFLAGALLVVTRGKPAEVRTGPLTAGASALVVLAVLAPVMGVLVRGLQ